MFHCSVIKVLKLFLCCLSTGATLISYHSFFSLSTTFFNFFIFVCRCCSHSWGLHPAFSVSLWCLPQRRVTSYHHLSQMSTLIFEIFQIFCIFYFIPIIHAFQTILFFLLSAKFLTYNLAKRIANVRFTNHSRNLSSILQKISPSFGWRSPLHFPNSGEIS